VRCLKKDDILISADVKEHYVVSSENRKSITIIEMINAADDFSFFSMMIIQDQEIMIS
jgi:hypothetical protein